MRYDAGYYTAENFAVKFKKLLDYRYSHLKEHKRRSAFEAEYLELFQTNEEKNNISSSVKQWFSYKQKPSIEKLMNICEMLDCDIDYFLTPQEEFKKEFSQASTVTGLSYESIEKICKLKTSNKTTLNKFILHSLFNNLLQYVDCYIDSEMMCVILKRDDRSTLSNDYIKQHELKKLDIYKTFDNIIVDLLNQNIL